MTQIVEPFKANPFVITGQTPGPNPYPAGGFTLDLVDALASLDFLALAIETNGANLPPCHFEIATDIPSAGQARITIMQHLYDRAPTSGTPTGQPAGVTVQGVLSGVDAAGGHTHASQGGHLGHGVVSPAANALLVDALGAGIGQNTTHLHESTAGDHSHAAIANHPHNFAILYQHTHPDVSTTVTYSVSELGAVDLSATVLGFCAIGAER